MSAPESSNSKTPPSLLSDKAKGAGGNGSRILANLEGRVEPPAEKTRRSKAPLAVLAVLLIAAGGWGAWHMQQRNQAEALASAGTDKPAAAVAAASGSQQIAAAVASAPVAVSSQAATIIADENDGKSASSPASASASGDDGSRLSRALADGAEPGSATAEVASAASSAKGVPAESVGTGKHAKSGATVAASTKHETAAHGKKESASAHHAAPSTALAQSKKAHAVNDSHKASKDDSDADLLAALVARTKPADTKSSGGDAATRVSATTPVAASGNAKLAERVKECSQRGFFEDQLCRWRVCDGHWGKDPSCPASAQQARQP
ncbi:hypothetical protein P3T18_006805 [Paraburkholderia sp. GAS199]|uniref:hypothetical protein n=1 Tax=Paraburkholderia sp. GAS199 TaxID=3035126 RepID=UPI003D2118F4